MGDLVRRVATDCGCVATVVKDALLPVLVSLAALGAMFTIMWRMDPLLTLLALAVVPSTLLWQKLVADVIPTQVGQLSADGRWRWYDSLPR